MFRLSCNLYDNLEILAVRKAVVSLEYTNEEGEILNHQGKISDLSIVDGLESVVMDDGLVVATKDIIRANDLNFKE